LRLASDVALEIVDGSAVVLHLTRCEYFDLNQVATRIVQLVDTGASTDDVANALAAEYDVELERAADDVTRTVEALVGLGIFENDG
jgi:hypothetical protein